MRDPFVISGILWHEIGDKVAFGNANAMEDVLNEYIDIEIYGGGLKGIAVIFIVVQPSNTIHEEVTRYSRKKKELYIQKKLPFDLVSQYDKDQVLQLMAITYLKVLQDEELGDLRIPNFDLTELRKDITELFEAQGWLNTSEVA